MMHLVCSPSLYFEATRFSQDYQTCEVIVDHYTPGEFWFLFAEGKGPRGIDVEAIKAREKAGHLAAPWGVPLGK